MAIRQRVCGAAVCVMAAVVLCGCEEPPVLGGVPLTAAAARELHQRAADEEAEQRRRFVESADPEALRWLLGHCVAQGMSSDDVGQILGTDGERIYEDGFIKRSNPRLLQTDATYKWGPDRDGHALYLIFRDDKLVNFDPHEYR